MRILDVAAFTLVLLLATANRSPAATAPSGPFVMMAVRAEPPPPLVASIEAPVWKRANHVSFEWDFTFHRPASERTTAYLLYDDKYVYVACIALQKTPVIATQHTNDVGDDEDDNCSVQFWPSGVTGIRYKFTATSLGTRYQESSENDTYAPHWDAVGRSGNGGFTVVMRIPLGVMRGDGRTEWRLNFQRLKRQTGEIFMWATDPGMQEDDEGQFAGYLRGMTGIKASTQTRPRLALYELAALASSSAGGSTSRMGVDAALPISRGTSVLATVHPDYSNVELDQQAIQPTEFPRLLQEVRPFFVQGANYYNRFDQVGNTNNIMLYTPSIETPRMGFAVEGHEGGAGFAAFNSIGKSSLDSASALFWNSADKRFLLGYQRVAVAQPDLYDLAQAGTLRYDNLRNFFVYASYGADRGTNVADPNQGNWKELGAGFHTERSRLVGAVKEIGAFYSPVDGIVDHPDIAGYAVEGLHRIDFGAHDWFRFAELNADLERYHDRSGRLDQADQSLDVNLAARNLFALSASTGSHFLLNADGTEGLFNENQVGLSYNAEGATPALVSYGFGRFGNGFLQTWIRTISLRVAGRALFDVESDQSRYAPDQGGVSIQRLERAAITMQVSANDSFTAGVRRVVGPSPGIGGGIQLPPGSNVSFAFHHRSRGAELYFVYGDPNAERTYPVLAVKLIEYLGAEKGS